MILCKCGLVQNAASFGGQARAAANSAVATRL